LQPCNLPLSVLQAMRAIPSDTLPQSPQISRLIDYETLGACVRRLQTGKSVGTDEIPREFYKFGPRFLLLRAAINAYQGYATAVLACSARQSLQPLKL
jgi:hypothetical protein